MDPDPDPRGQKTYGSGSAKLPYPTFLFEYGLRIRRAKTEETIAETEHLWNVEVDSECLFLAGTLNFMPIYPN
jgi:hypothetical protein